MVPTSMLINDEPIMVKAINLYTFRLEQLQLINSVQVALGTVFISDLSRPTTNQIN